MKKILSLFAMAALASAAYAQLASGDYLILNQMYGKYLNGSNNWGTKVSVTKHGQFMTLASVGDGKYTINSHYSNGVGKDYVAGGDNTFLDAAATNHEITEDVEGSGMFSIKDPNGMYLTTDGNVANFNGAELTMADTWAFITKEQYVSVMTESFNKSNPVDFTAFIPDANFSRNNTDFNKWTGASKMGKGGPNDAMGATATGMNAEKWGGNSSSIDFGTTVEGLPNGKYELSFQGFYRYNNTDVNTNDIAAATHADGSELILVNLTANEQIVPFLSIADEDAVATYGKMPFSQTEAAQAFTLGCYKQTVQVDVTDGTLAIKIVKNEADHPGTDWAIIDNLELYLIDMPNSTGIDAVNETKTATAKMMKDGKFVIVKNGREFNAAGMMLK